MLNTTDEAHKISNSIDIGRKLDENNTTNDNLDEDVHSMETRMIIFLMKKIRNKMSCKY